MSKSFSPQSPRSLPPCRLCGKDNKNSPFSKLSFTWQSPNSLLHSPTSQTHLNMQLVQVYSVLMCCLETNSDAVFCRREFCHSQLVKEDGCLLICQTDFKRILYTELGQKCSKSETHLVVANLLHPCLMSSPEEGNCLRADFAPSLARAIHCGDLHGEVGPSRLAWSRGQRVRL